MDAIKARYSYRGTFTDKPVTREQLTAILQAGLEAPSGKNAQTTELIGVDDPALLKELADIMAMPYAPSAKAAVIVITEPQVVFNGRSFHVQDYSAAIENMLLAIADMGFASVWAEGVTSTDDKNARIAKLLGIPDNKTVVCYMPIGEAANPGKQAPRKPFNERAWFNGYRR